MEPRRNMARCFPAWHQYKSHHRRTDPRRESQAYCPHTHSITAALFKPPAAIFCFHRFVERDEKPGKDGDNEKTGEIVITPVVPLDFRAFLLFVMQIFGSSFSCRIKKLTTEDLPLSSLYRKGLVCTLSQQPLESKSNMIRCSQRAAFLQDP